MNGARVTTYNKEVLYKRASQYDLSSFKGKIIGAPSHFSKPNKYSPESIFFRAIDVLKNKIKIWHELLKEKSKK